MKVKDSLDKVVSGVTRNKNGGLVVDDKLSYVKYKNDITIQDLLVRVVNLEKQIQTLMEKSNG